MRSCQTSKSGEACSWLRKDPQTLGLRFERFWSVSGPEMGTLDQEMNSTRRDQALRYSLPGINGVTNDMVSHMESPLGSPQPLADSRLQLFREAVFFMCTQPQSPEIKAGEPTAVRLDTRLGARVLQRASSIWRSFAKCPFSIGHARPLSWNGNKVSFRARAKRWEAVVEASFDTSLLPV